MNGHIKQSLVELIHTRGSANCSLLTYRQLQSFIVSTISCIQEINKHDKQRLVEFYKFKILNKYEKNYEVILMRRFFHPCFSRFYSLSPTHGRKWTKFGLFPAYV